MPRAQSYLTEFNSLAESAGINVSPSVIRIISELLAMQVAPEEIYKLLKSICPITNKSGKEK